jgi:predicted transcriptional regulator
MKSKLHQARRSMTLLKRFVADTFESAWEIEMITTLFSAQDKKWSSQELAELLPADVAQVDRCLARLTRDGYIGQTTTTEETCSRYMYMPDTAEKRALLGLLVVAHREGDLSLKRMLYD